MDIECYAQRLLNPFRGVVNVIKYGAAEAVTMDGVNWDIYVANDALRAGLRDHAQISDIRYGHWSAAAGLKRGALYPSDDFKRMELLGHVVYDYLRQHHQDVPFRFADRFELWLLDAANRPLALIHSVPAREDIDADAPRRWRAGFAAEAHFRSAALADPENSATHLANHINRRAAGWQWIERDAAGGGAGLAGSGALQGFEAADFPPLMLADNGGGNDAAEYAALAADYLAWQAPWLLLLQTLGEDARRRLEVSARSRAAEMVRQHRLYPAHADPAQIKAARVELVLREKTPEVREQANPATSPFYIELNPQGDT